AWETEPHRGIRALSTRSVLTSTWVHSLPERCRGRAGSRLDPEHRRPPGPEQAQRDPGSPGNRHRRPADDLRRLRERSGAPGPEPRGNGDFEQHARDRDHSRRHTRQDRPQRAASLAGRRDQAREADQSRAREGEGAVFRQSSDQDREKKAAWTDSDHPGDEANRVGGRERHQEDGHEREPPLSPDDRVGPVDILGAYPPFEERQARTAPYRVRGGRSDQRPDGGDENAHHGAIQSPRENRHENTRDRRDKNLGDLEPEQDQGAPMPGASEEPFQARAGE